MSIADLAKEFPREDVHWRVQGKPYERNGSYSAMALAYIDARDVMDRLDEACGPSGWQDEYEVHPSGLIVCRIGVRVDDGWVWKSDGAGETAVEGKKGGISDALKRAAVKWGIGRYLYRLDSPWVKCVVRDNRGTPAWKSWAEDPWSKVKTTTYQAAETSQNTVANDGDPNILEMINGATTEEQLKSHWTGNESYQSYAWFKKAINARKAELQKPEQQKEAA